VAYADNATVFCDNLNSARQVKETFDKFSKYSGLLLNASKICGVEVKRGGVKVALCGMKSKHLLTDSVKILGIYYSLNDEIIKEKK
jgi:hypothetical protein